MMVEFNMRDLSHLSIYSIFWVPDWLQLSPTLNLDQFSLSSSVHVCLSVCPVAKFQYSRCSCLSLEWDDVCAVLQNWNMHPGAHFQDPSSQQLECMYRIPTRRPPTKRATRTWKFAMQYNPEGGGEWAAFCVYKPTHPWHSSTHIHIIIIIFINTPISTSISTCCAFHSAMIRLGWLVGWLVAAPLRVSHRPA